MKTLENITIIDYDKRYARKTVIMWRESYEKAIGIHSLHSIEDHLIFLETVLAIENEVYLAIHEPDDEPVGIMAIDRQTLNQLYIHVDFQSIGIGSKLLKLAKAQSRNKLRLNTFEVNTNARLFYEKHGFKIVGRGADNEEQLPDIQYQW